MEEIYNKKELLILNYIQNNSLEKKFVNVTSIMSKYSLRDYIKAYIIYEKYSFTLREYDMYVKENNLHFPKKTQMCEFIQKLSKYSIMKNIYLTHLPKTDSNIISIDSSFIQNKSNSLHVDRNRHYYNKKGIKVTALVDDNELPTEIKITKASINDAKIANDFVNEIPIKSINDKILLADAGYDSSIIKNTLRKKKCKFIIAKNKRNKKTKKEKLQAKKLKNIVKKIKNEYNIEIKKINLPKNIIKRNNKGIGVKKKIKYKKRIKVEHFFSKLKQKRLMYITSKKIATMYHFIFSRCIDLLFFSNFINFSNINC